MKLLWGKQCYFSQKSQAPLVALEADIEELEISELVVYDDSEDVATDEDSEDETSDDDSEEETSEEDSDDEISEDEDSDEETSELLELLELLASSFKQRYPMRL